MLKKIGIVSALSTALLFGGAFHNTADASAKADYVQKYLYKIYYPINIDSFTNTQIDELFKQILNINIWGNNWDGSAQLDINSILQQNGTANNNGNQSNQNGNVGFEKPDYNVNNNNGLGQNNGQSVQPPKQDQTTGNNNNTQVQKPENKPTEDTNNNALSQYEKQVVELTNKERTSRGLKALEIDLSLSKSAHEKSRDMAANNYFSHTSPTYGSPFDMMKKYGVTYQSAGENIAKGQKTPAEVVDAWMNSEGHRANILNASFTHIGVGYVSNGSHWTQQFIGK